MRDIELAAPNRRNLLVALGVGAVGAAGVAFASSPLSMAGWVSRYSTRTASWWERTFSSLRHGGVDEWSQLVGETFAVPSEGSLSGFRVASVTPLVSEGKRPPEVTRKQAFVVKLQVQNISGGDRIFRVAHPGHDPLDIHVGVPFAEGARKFMSAIFN